jgi:hypothetical protein
MRTLLANLPHVVQDQFGIDASGPEFAAATMHELANGVLLWVESQAAPGLRFPNL